MNFARSILISLTALSVALASQAQLTQPHRFEETVKPAEDGFTVISLKKEGLAMVREGKYDQGKKKWQLEIVDTTLSELWSTELEQGARQMLVGYEYNVGHLYLLFREGESDFHNFQLLTLQFHEKTIQADDIKFELNFKLTHFTVAGSTAVFGGYINNEPAVLLYNQLKEHPKVLPGFFDKDISLLDVRTNQNQSFNVLLTETKTKDKKHMILRTYDQEGNLLIDDIITIDPRFSILSGITSALEREELMIAGTYGEGSNRMASGIFSVTVDPFNEQPVTYTDFCSMIHFLDYLKPKRAAKIREKAEKERASGQPPDFKAYVAPIRIDEQKGGFYFLAESYYPSDNSTPYSYPYSMTNPNAYGYYPYGISPFANRYYNAPYSYNNPVRNSTVQMNQSLVIKLGPRGKVGRDVSLALDDIKGSVLEQIADFTVQKDSIVLLYKKDNEIVLQKEPPEPEEPPVIKRTKVKLKETTDELKNENEEEGMIRHWYENNFYIWGYQHIKIGTESRYVFYVNRVTLE